MERKSKFSGSWYPADIETIKSYLAPIKNKIAAKGILCPHAGYIYSGKTAGKVYSQITIPENIIIISPNHTGYGSKVSLFSSGQWSTPFGKIEVNTEFTQNILKNNKLISSDTLAHEQEHSIELQLPFLQALKENFKIIPLTIQFISLQACQEIGETLAKLILEKHPNTLIVASSDMSHGETLENTTKKDSLAIEKLLKLDPKGLYETVIANSITMCGFIPAAIMLYALKKLGATKANLIEQTNSYKVSKNADYIVGYAGIIIS